MNKSFNETMGVMYADYFNKHTPEETYDFVFKTSIAISVLNDLYKKFISEGVDELGKIPEEKKTKYWELSCKYFTELPQRLQASKAIYTLELICSNF